MISQVFDTFGPVARPLYAVRYRTPEEIDRERAQVNARIYFVPSYQRTKLVHVDELKKMKFTDASNVYDEEIGSEVVLHCKRIHYV